ncbi:uncharacterized protein SPAPADRAFT_141112 [Spathaspora passalidarum NRRL Y-27907]|uniref:HMG box domain-containing protein n=1 Tax=Spathaspora passalidarum (strain NRRL Y-27907 / 11-Y1) TaxID=619300 RepID=G3ARU1_SPAPN|nr:uncharacterized protein SPAPADRAFT_141112 [Spathaspora passalidarum NRRL Y-27907]EGW31358.1 hypothetical protein SPAPADRAFT_141112 [Spathaspora passalidarum NRRL Y-27907]
MKVQAKDTAPESEEQKFKQKCKELKKRVIEIEESNEIATLALSRTQAAIRRLRLEYVILLERLEERATSLPEGIVGFEEMACPPTPSVLDETLTKKNGLAKKQIKRKPASSSAESAPTPKVAKVRDPDLPKRPTNAYLIFCEMEKERIKQENEEKNPGVTNDLSKSMTEAWKLLNEEDRKPYYKLYEDDRDRYQREMAIYNQKKQGTEEVEEPEAKRQKLDTETPEVDSEVPEPVEEVAAPVEEAATPIVKDEPETDPVQEEEDIKEEEETPKIITE